MKLLLIEDDAWLAEMYGSALQKVPGAEVASAATAKAALAAIDTKQPDLIILDIFLPDHTGIEFLHEIASYDDSASIPVVILSAVHEHDFTMSKDRWLEYGVIDYLYKPAIKPQDLTIRVTKILLDISQGVVV